MGTPSTSAKRFCWICGRVVALETCKIDEHGLAVHESCYVTKIALQNIQIPMMAKRMVKGRAS
jgi:hypothetical protein